jgi:hypothetical protein
MEGHEMKLHIVARTAAAGLLACLAGLLAAGSANAQAPAPAPTPTAAPLAALPPTVAARLPVAPAPAAAPAPMTTTALRPHLLQRHGQRRMAGGRRARRGQQ